MLFKRFFGLSLLLLIAVSVTPAQGLMNFTNYTGSTSTSGMGEEGVALRNSEDAFTYNPANLAYSDKLRLTLFHEPFQFWESYPLNNISASFKIKGLGSFGLQYLRHDLGRVELTTRENPDGIGEFIEYYNYALSLGYAAEVTDELSLGLAVKYGNETYGKESFSAFLFSGGLNYQPELLRKRVNLGFSLMNMGGPVAHEATFMNAPRTNPETYVKMEIKTPVASMMHLALSAIPIETDYISTTAQFGFSKYFADYGSDYWHGKSSFSALFSDWKDFPRDAWLHAGLSFEWKPLNLGNDFSFFQNYYVGTKSPGPKAPYLNNDLTHGAEIGIGYKEISFLMGYSGRWHNVGMAGLFAPNLPYESFQFSFEWDINKQFGHNSEGKSSLPLKNIIVSAGASYNFRGGNLFPSSPDYDLISRNGISYIFETAFYINKNNALLSGVYYTSMPVGYSMNIWGTHRYELKTKFETIGIYSLYRYHPLESFPFLYVQGGLGIVRLNPVAVTAPKYLYRTSINTAIGANLDLFNNNLIISPELNYQLMFVTLYNSFKTPRLGGENQVGLMVKAGYRF